jgi:hypothetical protein
LDLTVGNIPALDGTLVVIDTSGSMQTALSRRSTMSRVEVAAVMAMAIAKRAADVDVVIYGQDNALVRGLDGASVLAGVDKVVRSVGCVGHATYGHTAIARWYNPRRRIGWHATMSFELSGVPVRQDAMRHLCDTFDVEEPLFYRPRTEHHVQRHRAEDSPLLDVIGFVVQEDGLEIDPKNREWSCGVIATNPYRGQLGNSHPAWWPDDSKSPS